MSDGEVLPPMDPFKRGCKARASLPSMQSNGQQMEKPLGVLYLQYGEETKQVWMPAEINSQESLRALFVTAFPHHLTMKMMQAPHVAIYVKEPSRNFYYELEDNKNITSHSCLKVYHKDPAHGLNHHGKSANRDKRLTKEVLYGSHSPIRTQSSPSHSTKHALQGAMSPPMVRSMPSSPSRVAYSGGSIGRHAWLVNPSSATLPRECLSGTGQTSVLCNNSSAIMERRDVKPDEDPGSNSSMALMMRCDGGSQHSGSYCSSLQDRGGGRSSIASSHCSGPPSYTADMVDTGIPGGLQQYRASIKPLMGYGESMEHQFLSLHRQRSRKYGDSHFSPLGAKSPPPSPQRVNEARTIDGQIIGGVGLVSPERMSPCRRASMRRDSNGAMVEGVSRSRRSQGSSSSTSSVFVDTPLGQPEGLFQGPVCASNVQSERMKAMEEQIASLAGLVHHALSMGTDTPTAKDDVSEITGQKLFNGRPGTSCEPHNPAAITENSSTPLLALQAPPSDSGLQQSLELAKTNACELRLQLYQLRHLQLSNQESVRTMLRMAGQELVTLMCDGLVQSEKAEHRRKAEMEEERIRYLATEERILLQLSELEDYVNSLQISSTLGPGQLSITVTDVEEGAVKLHRVGKALAHLKGEFPALQAKMHSVLRLEVEAVRFLKEEPQKMDSILKRVKSLTEALSSLRRCVSESTLAATTAQVEPLKVLETEQGPQKTQSPQSSPKPQPRSSVRLPLPTPSIPGSQEEEIGLLGSTSSMAVHKTNITAAKVIEPSSHHHPNPPLTPTHGRDSPTVAKVNPRSREPGPALQKRPGPSQADGYVAPKQVQEGYTYQSAVKQDKTPSEATKRQTLRTETSSINQSSTSQANQLGSSRSGQPPSHRENMDRLLQEAQATLIESSPDLSVSEPREDRSVSTSGGSDKDAPLDLTLQASVEQQPLVSQDTLPILMDKMDSSQLKCTDTVSQLPASAVDPPPSASPSAPLSTERSGRPQVEKPRRSAVGKEMKHSPDKGTKSPPPPPRRFHAVTPEVITGTSGDISTRKEPDGAQDEAENKKEPPVPKSPRQPPKVKPKPQMFANTAEAGSIPAPATTSTPHTNEEGNKGFMKASEVSAEMSHKNTLPGGNKSQVAYRIPSQLAAQPRPKDGVPHKLTAVGIEKHSEVGKDGVRTDETETEEKMVKQVPSLKCSSAEHVELFENAQNLQRNTKVLTSTPKKADQSYKMEVHSVQTPEKEINLNRNTPHHVVRQVCSPPKSGVEVKYTIAVTLQKEYTEETDITSPEQIHDKVTKEVPPKKANLLAVITSPKENTLGGCPVESSPETHQDKGMASDPVGGAPTTVLKPKPLSPSHSSEPQNQEAAVWVLREKLDDTEGGSLSPDAGDDEGPPPPPPSTEKMKIRISRTKFRTQSREGDVWETAGEATYLEDGNDSKSKPNIFVLNEPMDIQSALKRLSTIFENEEDHNGIFSSKNIADTKQEENKQLGLDDITGNDKNSVSSTDKSSIFEKQNQGKPELLQKTGSKKKLSFKFPKNKLAAISEAFRTGKTKTGKKALEDAEEKAALDSRPIKETKKQTKGYKKSDINSTKPFNFGESNIKVPSPIDTRDSKSHYRGEKICSSTSESINGLEDSIKLLEITETAVSSTPPSPTTFLESTDRAHLKGKVKRERERSPSKRPAHQIFKGPEPPQSKRAKPQPVNATGKPSTKKQTSSRSSVQRPHTKTHQSSCLDSPEKTPQGRQPPTQERPSQVKELRET